MQFSKNGESQPRLSKVGITNSSPTPLTPADCDLRNYPWMKLDVVRLRRSKTWRIQAKRNPELGFYHMNLWAASWHELPAASLEDDEDVLADLAMCDPERWAVVRDEVMRAWVKCSDGRFYHPVVAEVALEAWSARQAQVSRTEAARAGRAAKRAESTDSRKAAEMAESASVTENVTAQRQNCHRDQTEITERDSAQDIEEVERIFKEESPTQNSVPTKLYRQRVEIAASQNDQPEPPEPPSHRAKPPPSSELTVAATSPTAESRPSSQPFEEFWKAYPRKVGKGAARQAHAKAIRKATAAAILAALERTKWSTDPRYIPHPATWLHGERWLDEAPAPKPTSATIDPTDSWGINAFISTLSGVTDTEEGPIWQYDQGEEPCRIRESVKIHVFLGQAASTARLPATGKHNFEPVMAALRDGKGPNAIIEAIADFANWPNYKPVSLGSRPFVHRFNALPTRYYTKPPPPYDWSKPQDPTDPHGARAGSQGDAALEELNRKVAKILGMPAGCPHEIRTWNTIQYFMTQGATPDDIVTVSRQKAESPDYDLNKYHPFDSLVFRVDRLLQDRRWKESTRQREVAKQQPVPEDPEAAAARRMTADIIPRGRQAWANQAPDINLDLFEAEMAADIDSDIGGTELLRPPQPAGFASQMRAA